MKEVEAIKRLVAWDRRDKFIFDARELSLALGERGDRFRATVTRLVADGVLTRAARGLYVYELSSHLDAFILHRVAMALRPGRYVYESFESAASRWGFISQIPVDRITFATTGATGTFRTPYGVIELTHVRRGPLEILDGTVDRAPMEPTRLAKEGVALEDMLAVPDRCVELIDWDVLEEDGYAAV